MTVSKSRSLAKHILQGTSASIVGQAVYVGSNALFVILLTRYFLTPEEFGGLFFALSVLGVFTIFANLGVPQSTARYVNEYLERDPTQIRYIIRVSSLIVFILVSVVGIALAASSPVIASLLGTPSITPLLQVGAIYVAVSALNSQLSNIFRGFNRITMSAALTAISSAGRVTFAVGFLLLGMGTIGVLLGYVAGFVFAIVVGSIVLYWQVYRSTPATTEPRSDLPSRILKYSVPLTVTKGAGVIDTKVDSILVGLLLNPVAVGYYVISKQVASVVSTPAGAFGTALSPTVGQQNARDDAVGASRLYQTALRYVLVFYIPAGVGLIFVAEPVIELIFGREYLPAVIVLQVFTGVVIVQSVNKVTSDTLDYLGKARDRAVSKSAMAVANAVLNVLLIPILGVAGAAVATVITQSFYTVANVYIISGVLTLDFRAIARDLMTIGLVTLGMSIAVVLALPYVDGLPSLIGIVLLGGGVWATLSVAGGLVDLGQVRAML